MIKIRTDQPYEAAYYMTRGGTLVGTAGTNAHVAFDLLVPEDVTAPRGDENVNYAAFVAASRTVFFQLRNHVRDWRAA
jgi:hypothetical protein